MRNPDPFPCPECGYLLAQGVGPKCPECGGTIETLLREQAGIEANKARWRRRMPWLLLFVLACAGAAELRIGDLFGFDIALLGLFFLGGVTFMSAVGGSFLCFATRSSRRGITMTVSMLICASTLSISFLPFPLAWFHFGSPPFRTGSDETRFVDTYMIVACCAAVGAAWAMTRLALGLTPRRKRTGGWYLTLMWTYPCIGLCSMYAWWLGLLLLPLDGN